MEMPTLNNKKHNQVFRIILIILTLFFIFHYWGIKDETWVLFVFMTTFEFNSMESMEFKSYNRLAMLLLSVVYSVLIIYCFENNYYFNIIGLLGGILGYAYFFLDTPLCYMGIVGCAIMSIILLNENTISHSFLRALIIVITIIVSMLVMRFFKGTRVRDELYETQAHYILLLSVWMKNHDQSQETQRMVEKKIHTNQLNYYTALEIIKKNKKESNYALQYGESFKNLQTMQNLLCTIIYYKPDTHKLNELAQHLEQVYDSLQQGKTLLSLPTLAVSDSDSSIWVDTLWKDIYYQLSLFETSLKAFHIYEN